MKPYYQDNHIRIFSKDCRDMSELAGESVQMVCTSPPYWGLRKYSGEQELIWGNEDCQHRWVDEQIIANASATTRWQHEEGGYGGNRFQKTDNPREAVKAEQSFVKVSRGFCSLCGAWKGAYGLEPTPEIYVQHTIEILREVRRVLRSDGVCFLNLGDSYGTGASGDNFAGKSPNQQSRPNWEGQFQKTKPLKHPIIKPKDLCLIPFKVAIAAQEDGWWVRSVIIWSKPNPMPESVTDRPTESHEYILMLTKSGTTQYWTHRDGNREASNPDYRWTREGIEVSEMPEGWTPKHKMGWNRVNLWRGHDYYWDAEAVREPHTESTLQRVEYGLKHRHPDNVGIGIPPVDTDRMGERFAPEGGRNIRSVWEFPTQPYPEAHFAVFPEKLPEICIKAATPEVGCCSKCGAPWERVIEKGKPILNAWSKKGAGNYDIKIGDWKETSLEEGSTLKHSVPHETLGWQPTCKCNADKVPSIVLDPFAGAGTTLWVAKKLNRRAVGYEISEEYCKLAVDRCRQQVML